MPLRALFEELLTSQAARITAGQIEVENLLDDELCVIGERFLLQQALANLLDNAVDFTPPGGLIRCSAECDGELLTFSLFNQGEPIPDYALPRLTERFYSLPRPGSGRKSTGLGLNFVQEVLELHGGELQLLNVAGGVEARLQLPAGGSVA